jgi:hypothetical protein
MSAWRWFGSVWIDGARVIKYGAILLKKLQQNQN